MPFFSIREIIISTFSMHHHLLNAVAFEIDSKLLDSSRRNVRVVVDPAYYIIVVARDASFTKRPL
jgi:hypothetical protein